MALLNSFFKIIAFCKGLSITNLLPVNAAVLEKNIEKSWKKKLESEFRLYSSKSRD